VEEHEVKASTVAGRRARAMNLAVVDFIVVGSYQLSVNE
jgi:hypothetical protein